MSDMLTRFLSVFSKRPKRSPLPPLYFRNTLSGDLEEFIPLSRKVVKMYNCGPTVYGPQHIGNMRAAVFANTIRRALDRWGYDVKQVINITDFGHLVADADQGEDKMTAGLKREGMELTLENMHTLAEKYAEQYLSDIRLLGVDTDAITFPRASAYIPEQIALIRALVEKGYAYKTKNGVYFEVARFPSYGKLGGVKLSGLKEGARIKGHSEKRGPFDFTLWKRDAHLGWDSPWGKGFPGWHIECTAMIFKLLGKQIDIHTGGIEHIPVHHNNEIAQAEAASGKRFVKYWMHNDHIMVEGKKISKSIGNTVYLYNVTDRGFSPLALRYWFLTAHYRSPANFTWDALSGAAAALAKLKRFFLEELPRDGAPASPDPAFMKDVLDAIAHDLDTPKVIARMWELVKDTSVSPAAKRASLLEVDALLGLGLAAADSRAAVPSVLAVAQENEKAVPEEVAALVEARTAAREARDFAKADDLRAKITELGYEIKDTSDGAQLSRISEQQ